MQNFSVIIFGPTLNKINNGYGGGQGGIVSAISRMVEYFEKHQISFIYSQYSIRSYSKYWYLKLPYRLINDLVAFGKICFLSGKHKVAHVVADGGLAAYRTLFAVLTAKAFGVGVVTDVRGNGLGTFADGRESLIGSVAWKLIVKHSKFVLVQRQSTIDSLFGRYDNKILLHSNWLASDKVYERKNSILCYKRIKIGFVGYCFADKGVYEIVEGCELAAKQGVELELHFIGAESADFTFFLDSWQHSNLFFIVRHGKVSQAEARLLMKTLDVFIFPSNFKSEGHPNVINEAMFAKLAIITSEAGAVREILDESMAYFIPPRSAISIAEKLVEIDFKRGCARVKADAAFQKVTENYGENQVLGSLLSVYARALQPCSSTLKKR